MKIGIMTWFHYENYGTALQVTALSRYLRDLGHQPEVINYIPRGTADMTVPDYSIGHLVQRIPAKLKRNPVNRRSKNRDYYSDSKTRSYQTFLRKNTTLTDVCHTYSDLFNLNDEFDAFICGSDQIWSSNNFEPPYYLNFVADSGKKIAYAPSIGVLNVGDPYLQKKISELISGFDHLSTREAEGAQFIHGLTGLSPAVVCDPTVLLTGDQWRTFQISTGELSKQKPYLLVYFLGDNPVHWEKVQNYARGKNLEIKIIPVFEEDLKKEGAISEPVGPGEFLSLIDGASLVCTDSFHGLILSLNLQSQVIPFERFAKGDPINQNSRIVNILSKCDLQDILVGFDGAGGSPAEIDYSVVSQKLELYRNESVAWLNNVLNKVEASHPKRQIHIDPEKNLCCGCSVCSKGCPTGAIQICMNNKGFLAAKVDEKLCIECGKCTRVCPFYGESKSKKISDCSLFSYKDKRDSVLKKSSSGGAAYAISEVLLKNGYKVLGATKNPGMNLPYFQSADSIEDLSLFQGSKYLQSDFSNAADEVLDSDKPLVIIGLPCQIAAARKLSPHRANTLYIDLICHGVPSFLVYKSYLSLLNKDFGMNPEQIRSVFRNKEYGWRDYTITNTDENISVSLNEKTDYFLQFFQSTACYNDSCYECRWRDCSAADIRLGDYWGPRFEGDTTGVSMVIPLTESGRKTIDLLSKQYSGDLKLQNLEDYSKYQQNRNYYKPLFHDELIASLRDRRDPKDIYYKYILPMKEVRLSLPERMRRIYRMVKFDNI